MRWTRLGIFGMGSIGNIWDGSTRLGIFGMDPIGNMLLEYCQLGKCLEEKYLVKEIEGNVVLLTAD